MNPQKNVKEDSCATPPVSFPDAERFSPSAVSPNQDIPNRPRRSSLTLGLGNFVHVGGVNSLDNFARSWTRAAGYFEITPTSTQTFVYSDVARGAQDEDGAIEDGEDEDIYQSYDYEDDVDIEGLESTPTARLLHSENRHSVPSTGFHSQNNHGLGNYANYGSYGSIGSIQSIHSIVGGGLGGSAGTRLRDGSIVQAASLFGQPDALTNDMREREPLLVTRVEGEDGRLVPVIVGQSTLPQTVFNSVNVLIGVGILSLPLGLKYSGWIVGMIYLAFTGLVTNYTAKLLARCLDKAEDKTLVTYADIAYAAYGHRARLWISALFSMELLAVCVALIILFADSLHNLIPSISTTGWKIVAWFLMAPLTFLPLRVLSFSSVLGILCSFGIVSIILMDGLIKPDAPGSLGDPMPTYLFPPNWYTVPMSFGLLMSPWGGHGVFPNIYKDMRHPYKYNKGVNTTYIFTYGLDLFLAILGYLMYGNLVQDEITSNILATKAYPRALNVTMIIFIAIIPLTKTPLNARPIVSTLDALLGLDGRVIPDDESMLGMSSYTRGILRILVRVLTNVIFVLMSIVFPSFDRVMGLLGSFLGYSICVILPMAFHLKICGDDIPTWERRMNYCIITISIPLAATGTIWTFL